MSLELNKRLVAELQRGECVLSLSHIPSMNRQICVMIFGKSCGEHSCGDCYGLYGFYSRDSGFERICIEMLVENLDEIMPRFRAEADIGLEKYLKEEERREAAWLRGGVDKIDVIDDAYDGDSGLYNYQNSW